MCGIVCAFDLKQTAEELRPQGVFNMDKRLDEKTI